MGKMSLRQIRAVIAVCEEGSFTHAAERENATQSGVSQHVAAVERTAGEAVRALRRPGGDGRDDRRARSRRPFDWATVLPSVICVNDIGGGALIVNPIAEPQLDAEFVVIQPARRTLLAQARLFLARLEQEVAHIHRVWREAVRKPRKPHRRRA